MANKKAHKKPKPKLLTRRELAAAVGVQMSTITKWERDGMPIAKRGSRGRPSLYDEQACRAWKQARDQAAERPTGLVSLEQARIQRETQQALYIRQTREQKAGLLLHKDDVERVWSQHVTAVCNILEQLPRHADALYRLSHSETEPAVCLAAIEARLTETVTAIRRELAGQVGAEA